MMANWTKLLNPQQHILWCDSVDLLSLKTTEVRLWWTQETVLLWYGAANLSSICKCRLLCVRWSLSTLHAVTLRTKTFQTLMLCCILGNTSENEEMLLINTWSRLKYLAYYCFIKVWCFCTFVSIFCCFFLYKIKLFNIIIDTQRYFQAKLLIFRDVCIYCTYYLL